MRQTRRTLKGALLKDLTLTFLFPFLLVLLTIFFYITASVEKETEQKNTIFAAQLSNQMQAACFLYNKNTNYCRWQSSKLQREFPYYCRALFGIFLSPQFLWI